MVTAVEEAATHVDKVRVMAAMGVDTRTVDRYTEAISARDAKPKKEREPLTARRLSGGGRKPVLTETQEADLEAWIMELRRQRLRVTEKMVKLEARRRYHIKASDMWLQGFMRRRGLCMRLRSTNKEVNTEKMQIIARHFRNKYASLFATKSHFLIFDMDETPLYLDAPGNRTIDKIGAKSVEIATTGHEKDRVTLVLCVSCAGDKVDSLIIHRCHEKKRMKKTNNLFKIINSEGVTLWISYCPSAYMNYKIMEKWIESIYKAHITSAGHDPEDSILFMDNMGAHDKEEVVKALSGHHLPTIFFPPNCTPILQPLDDAINARFKQLYEEQWAAWFREVGCKRTTKKGNPKKATEDDLNRWVIAALQQITPELVRASWRHTLMVPMNLMRLPAGPWSIITSFLSDSDRRRVLPLLNAHRARHDGSGFVFPVKMKKRRRED